tara:strand:- start:604 stop:2076 length:1473 start_codon:yes stop_codon:yes gene_type:complete
MEPRVMPSTIDYSSMLPLSIPAMASRRKFFPSNGSTFSRQGNRQIRIEIGHPSALLDPSHSFLELRVSNSGAQTFGLDLGGANCFFENIRVEQGGKILSYTQASNRLHSAILAPVQTSSEGISTESVTEGGRAYNTAVASSVVPSAAGQLGDQYDTLVHNSNGFQAALATVRFTMPITSGLFSQDKLIPLPLVDQNSPITLVLDMGTPGDAGCWNGAPGAADLVIAEVAYIAHMVEVGPDVINQFRMVQRDMGGQLALSGQDYEYFSSPVPAGTGGQAFLNCPARKRSIKSLFWCSQSNNFANTAGPIVQSAAYNLSFAGNMNIESFQYQVGPILYPAGEPVRCWGQTAGAGAVGNEFNRGQAAMELAKAVGTMSKTNPTGMMAGITYGADQVGLASGENGIAGVTHCPTSDTKYAVCPFGISTDSFARDIIESGVDTQTMAQETNLILNWGATAGVADTSGAEDQIVHMWALFDQHYYFNDDGSVTYSN